jgi:hypothetical protein
MNRGRVTRIGSPDLAGCRAGLAGSRAAGRCRFWGWAGVGRVLAPQGMRFAVFCKGGIRRLSTL